MSELRSIAEWETAALTGDGSHLHDPRHPVRVLHASSRRSHFTHQFARLGWLVLLLISLAGQAHASVEPATDKSGVPLDRQFPVKAGHFNERPVL